MATVLSSLKAFDVPTPNRNVIVRTEPIEHEHANEHTEHAYDLLKLYKFHVHSIESLIHVHEKDGRKLKSVEHKNKELEHDNKDLKKKNKDLKDKNEILQHDLTGTKKSLEDRIKDLDRTKKDRNALAGEAKDLGLKLRNVEGKYEKVQVDLEKSRKALGSAEAKLQEANHDLKDKECKIDALEELLRATKQKLDRALANDKADADAILDANAREEKALDRALKAEVDLKRVRDDLATSEYKRKESEDNFVRLNAKLRTAEETTKDMKDQLDKVHGELRTVEGKLQTTKEAREIAEQNNASYERSVKSLQTRLKTANDGELAAQGYIQNANTERDNAQARVEELEAKLRLVNSKGSEEAQEIAKEAARAEFAKQVKDAQEKAKAAEAKSKEDEANAAVAETKAKTAEEARATAEKKSSSFQGRADRTRGPYCIDRVIYGGKDITESNKTIVQKLLTCAVDGTQFFVRNREIGEDPWFWNLKSFTVAYTVDGKGPVKYLNALEDGTIKFSREN